MCESNDGRFKKGQEGKRRPDVEIQQISDIMHKGRYRFLGRDDAAPKYGLFQCREHGGLFSQIISTHLAGKVPEGCPVCIFEKRSTTTKNSKTDWSNRVKHPRYKSDETISRLSLETFKGRYKFMGRDKDYRYGLFKCPHGENLRQVLFQHTKGLHPKGCEKCRREIRVYKKRSDEEIRELGYRYFEGRVYFLGRDKINERFGDFICMEHGTRFVQNISAYVKGRRSCVLCRNEGSRLYNKLKKILEEKFSGMTIEQEKRFEDCYNKYQLRFDFYIPELNFLVECDGSQHFVASEFWGGQEGLEIRIQNDRIKDEYARRKKINFLRVAFFDEARMDEIVEKAKTLLLCNTPVYQIHGNILPM